MTTAMPLLTTSLPVPRPQAAPDDHAFPGVNAFPGANRTREQARGTATQDPDHEAPPDRST